MIALLLSGILIAAAPGANGAGASDGAYEQRRVALTVELTVEETPSPAEVWFPMPRQGKWQKLEGFELAGSRPYRVVSDSTYGNRFLVVDLPGGEGKERSLSVSFVITRLPIPKGEGEPDEEVLATKEGGEKNPLSLYLLPRRLIPLGGPIAQEARLVAGGLQEPMQIARQLFDHVVESMRYDKSGQGWGRGDALYACTERAGNCTDFHSLFIAQARALGLPARFIMGLPLPEDKTEGEIPGYHCWGEFFVEGKGWLPIDASEANKHIEEKDSYFATLDASRVAFTLGRDILVPDTHHGPFNYLIYPYVEAASVPYKKTKTRFFFRDLSR